MKVGIKMSITSKGIKWEIMNSLWILFTFTLGFFNWIAFFYIGYKAKCKKWIFAGLIYSIPFIIAMITEDSNNFTTGLILILGIASIVHAFKIRTEYLVRLESIYYGKILSNSEVKQIITKIKLSKMNLEYVENLETTEINAAVEPNFSKEKTTKTEDKELPKEAEKFTKESFENKLIDINTASESELAALPGIGLILAKKAINHRETNEYFNSIDEFAEVLSLKPHILERIRPLVTLNKTEPEHNNSDVSNKSGRIVDF